MGEKHKVVILGGGFGGLVAAQALKRADAQVTLIDKRNFHLFQPLLYQVATGSLSPGEIAAPLRAVLSRQKNTQVLLGEAVDIDPDARRVILRDGGVFPYDTLVMATGSQTSYYGQDQWRDWAPSLKTVEEATSIRHKLLYAFERAERSATEEEARSWLTFVIVGAGATGLELAGALAEIARETLRHDFRKINPEEARIILMEGSPRVLNSYPPDLSAKAERLVTRLGVKVMKDVMVVDIDSDGDLAHFEEEPGKPLPGVAQVAIQGGQYVGKVIRARLKGETYGKPFHYWNKGDMAVIGRAAAVANIFGLHVSGFLAWLVWLFIHLMYIVEFQSRVQVFIQWGFEYLTFSRGARLITGEAVTDSLTQSGSMRSDAKTQ